MLFALQMYLPTNQRYNGLYEIDNIHQIKNSNLNAVNAMLELVYTYESRYTTVMRKKGYFFMLESSEL